MWKLHNNKAGQRTNKLIIDQIEPHFSLKAQITKLKLSYFGRIRIDSLEKTIMLGIVEGKRGRGWPASRWMEPMSEIMNEPVRSSKTQTEDRTFWRNTVHMVTRSRKRLDGTYIYYFLPCHNFSLFPQSTVGNQPSVYILVSSIQLYRLHSISYFSIRMTM